MSDVAGVIVAIIGATAIIVAAIITSRVGSDRKLSEIHVLVNSRLTEALTEIHALRSALIRNGQDPDNL